ncbi:zinc ribbon domain-containing protein [Amycolatopsis sp. NPDC102389]|uniref:zinc ribbon domain-containing protein n=1 Tax=Amycolatopsis sp. NPDC102389 TaxID=3363941 RepID=UPI0037F4D442
MYDAINAGWKGKQGSRDPEIPNKNPVVRKTYRFRGHLFHSCGRRMVGESRHGRPYYLCRPSNNNRGRSDRFIEHEKALYLREDALLEAVAKFLRRTSLRT